MFIRTYCCGLYVQSQSTFCKTKGLFSILTMLCDAGDFSDEDFNKSCCLIRDIDNKTPLPYNSDRYGRLVKTRDLKGLYT